VVSVSVVVSVVVDSDSDGGGVGVFGGVGQRLGDGVVRAGLDRLGQPRIDVHVQLDRERCAAGQGAQGRTQPAGGQDRRVDAVGDLA
jgi:hypothetical protein